ncbi:MAG: hypothetical protein WDO73_07160 [Ignavibacteriota bacterium]
MAAILPLIVLASTIAFQASTTPTAPTPAGAPLPSKGKSGPKAVDSELAGDVKEDGVMSFARYEGGSFALKQNKLTTYVNRREVVLVQGKQRSAIPVKAVVEVLDGNAVHAQVGAATGSPVPASGTKNQSAGNMTVVGIVWTDADKKKGIVVRVDKGDFQAFVAALESVTGLTATNTSH